MKNNAQRTFGYWSKRINRRIFVDNLAKQLQLQKPADWGKVTQKQIINNGGGYLLMRCYSGSILQMLKDLYSEIEWKRDWFERIKIPKGFWIKISNRRKFFESIAQDFNIKNQEDWGKLTTRSLSKRGALSILNEYYNGSLFKALQHLFPEIKWEERFFSSRTHWKTSESRRSFFNSLALKMGIRKPSDWGNMTNRQVQQHGGAALLNYSGASLYLSLKYVFPEIKWEQNWFRRRWNNIDAQKQYLEKLASQFQMKTPRDWARINTQYISKFGGATLLEKYNGSLFSTLKSVYFEENWKRDWFPKLQKYSPDYFNNVFNQRVFMDKIRETCRISTPNQWKRVTTSLIRKAGGQPLLNKYGNTVIGILKETHPEIDWNEILDENRSMSNPQDTLESLLGSIIPRESIFVNYRKPFPGILFN